MISILNFLNYKIKGGGLEVRFKDEDGDMMNMQDEGDFEAALDVAR